MLCPCHSKKNYNDCCKPFHEGTTLPKNALELMRSRYSAYSLGLVNYLIETTHPTNPLFKKNHLQIEQDILQFSHSTTFTGLEIIEFIDGIDSAFVTFIATLQQAKRDASFVEKSSFRRVNGLWLYEKACAIDSK